MKRPPVGIIVVAGTQALLSVFSGLLPYLLIGGIAAAVVLAEKGRIHAYFAQYTYYPAFFGAIPYFITVAISLVAAIGLVFLRRLARAVLLVITGAGFVTAVVAGVWDICAALVDWDYLKYLRPPRALSGLPSGLEYVLALYGPAAISYGASWWYLRQEGIRKLFVTDASEAA